MSMKAELKKYENKVEKAKMLLNKVNINKSNYDKAWKILDAMQEETQANKFKIKEHDKKYKKGLTTCEEDLPMARCAFFTNKVIKLQNELGRAINRVASKYSL